MAARVFITGATGFLGSKLLPKLIEAGFETTLLKRRKSSLQRIVPWVGQVELFDLEDVDLERLFSRKRYDLVIHCATNYGRRESSNIDLITANLLLPLRLLELSSRLDASAFINTDTILDKRVSSYSLSKKQFKEWLMSGRPGQCCVNMMVEHFYGAGDDPTKFMSHVIGELLRPVARIPLTSGVQKRDFVYVDDVVDAFMQVIVHCLSHRSAGYHEYQIAAGKPVPIREAVELAKRLTGNAVTMLDFGALPMREGEVMNVDVDLRALHALGWQPKFSLEAGLVRMIDEERGAKSCVP
jgi:nucleoside-diphosphate-sugar epimerase